MITPTTSTRFGAGTPSNASVVSTLRPCGDGSAFALCHALTMKTRGRVTFSTLDLSEVTTMFTPIGDSLEAFSQVVPDLSGLIRTWDEIRARLREIGVNSDLETFLHAVRQRELDT